MIAISIVACEIMFGIVGLLEKEKEYMYCIVIHLCTQLTECHWLFDAYLLHSFPIGVFLVNFFWAKSLSYMLRHIML